MDPRLRGLGCRAWGFKVAGLRFEAWGLKFRVEARGGFQKRMWHYGGLLAVGMSVVIREGNTEHRRLEAESPTWQKSHEHTSRR